MRLILASASPRRAELLRSAGFAFDVLPVDVDERGAAGEAPEAYVLRLAMEKARRALERLGEQGSGEAGHYQDGESPALAVLGADTAVVADGKILGKPRDDADATTMIRRLAGRTHRVLTGVSLLARGIERHQVEVTAVEFLPMSDADIRWYVESGEGRDKAGGYAIQGLAARFIPRIQGSYSNVVGLPITAVHQLVAEIASAPRSGYSIG
jgi:septum formation protein